MLSPWETEAHAKTISLENVLCICKCNLARKILCKNTFLHVMLGAPRPRSSRRWNFEISATWVVTRHWVINWEEFGEKFWWVVPHSKWSTKKSRKFRPKFRPTLRPIFRPDFHPSHKKFVAAISPWWISGVSNVFADDGKPWKRGHYERGLSSLESLESLKSRKSLDSRLSFPATGPPDPRRASERVSGVSAGVSEGCLKGFWRVFEGFLEGVLSWPLEDPF